MEHKILINIEGNIGVGKTTFSNIIKEAIPDSFVVEEPIDIWLNTKDNKNENILDKFYQDKKRWSYIFQNFAYITRMMKIEDAVKNFKGTNIFLDRSLGCDLNVFSKMLYDEGDISELEYTIYKYWNKFYFDYVQKNKIQKTIYLYCSVDVCYNRIQQRGREAEKLIEREYLDKLKLYHDQWLLQSENILIIDCDKDFENDLNYRNEIIDKVKKYISE